MPLDGLVVKGIVQELQQIVGSRVDRIYQPEKNFITLKIYGKRFKGTLMLSAQPNYARVHITSDRFDNPQNPAPFCMLLRKFLTGGIIREVSQYQGDRVIDIHIKKTDEYDLESYYLLTCEIMGKHSNIILINKGTNRVLDGIKRIQKDHAEGREIIPGVLFERPPSQNKLDPWETRLTEAKFIGLLDHHFREGHKLHKFFCDTFQGFSPFVSSQLVKTCLGNKENIKEVSSISNDQLTCLFNSYREALGKLTEKAYSPAIAYDTESGEPVDLYWDPVYLDSQYERTHYPTLSEALDTFFTLKNRKEKTEQLRLSLGKTLRQNIKRIQLKLTKQTKEYESSEKGELYKYYGELLSANFQELAHAKDKEVTVTDYYQNPPHPIQIPIDPTKSPGDNIQQYYHKYKKSIARLDKLGKELKRTKENLKYLKVIQFQVEEADSLEDLMAIEKELQQQGFLKNLRNKNIRKDKKGPTQNTEFLQYKSPDGYTILVGKNNRQNDLLTQKIASKTDTWLHVKDIAGSHVIVRGENPPLTTLKIAASLAAYHSKARQSENVPVDYTLVKYVRKPKGAKPGMVIYDYHKTLFVMPESQQTLRVKE